MASHVIIPRAFVDSLHHAVEVTILDRYVQRELASLLLLLLEKFRRGEPHAVQRTWFSSGDYEVLVSGECATAVCDANSIDPQRSKASIVEHGIEGEDSHVALYDLTGRFE